MFITGQWVEFIPKTWGEFYDNLSAVFPDGFVKRSINGTSRERFIYVEEVMYGENDPYFGQFMKDGGEIVDYELGGWYRVRVGEKEMSFYKSVLRLKEVSVDEQVFMNCLLL